ncbi:MAG: biotin--[acetyl-CoA-carboxylase] ligase [Clostridia bacterium]|nr:biotin--[acetyl-CoA-carboxylase] ligase [Clostridia bacterium]NCC42966.1 biotin--[acetyl-CoA-carboxylase] ligase [Clostridia bacterium]
MESTKTKILRLLRCQEGYLSGQEMCEKLGVSRTAVWKYMKQLKEEGYEIQAVQNKGYQLVEAPDVLGESEIKSRLDTKWAGREVCFLEEVDSTNTQAKRMAEEGAPSGTLVVADMQVKGKGRRGRMWTSPKGSAIYMTLMLRPQIKPERASMLTLVMGLSVVQAIRETLKVDTCIKWPNDVVLNKKKLVGILTEMNAQMDYIEYLVIGIGINANMCDFPEELKDKATSLRMELGYPVNRAKIIAQTMKTFEHNYEIFEKTQDLSELTEAYQEVLANYDQPVRVLEPGHEYSGIARGINAQGELLVEREDGTVAEVYSGEVSVRGLYSYV